MSVCHWNEPDDEDGHSLSFLGTNCPDGNSEVNELSLGKSLKNKEP